MCHLPSDSPALRRLRCLLIGQLTLDIILCGLSVVTLVDFGYLGIFGAVCGIVGVSMGLGRGCGDAVRGFTSLLVLNAVACLASLVHLCLTVWLAATVEDWCCDDDDDADDDPSKSGLRALLAVR